MSKEIKERAQKVPKTIRVKTLIIAVIWLLSVVAGLITGWFAHIHDTSRVTQEASTLVSQLKVEK